ncbi:hypothetical protein PPYR_02254 [Photinus pyralis]|uniref:Phosphatidic acid phosphatase type 2/haloperoxidase domain-containing protein n=1 Tax=Photinus pyralis TaxID=7054 RepID=A0A1Y1MVF2_PHOPY|nr:putative phosphatidate phosphatase isoform X1 [Photinus pyralis]KAB0805284.1 hypothetical protein PPYR_02254 [Photinus pyralis]
MEHELIRLISIRKIIFDVLLLLCVGFPILFLYLWGDPYRRGFFCDDESIRHPFHKSSVPSYFLYIFGLGMTTVVMMVTEFCNCYFSDRKREFTILGRKFPYWVWNTYCVVGVFCFGAACSQLTTDVMKYTIGRLRPHFYTVCLPSIDCNDPKNHFVYHEEFHCTNPLYSDTKRILKEMRLSFPSGHSSFSMYSMVYFAIYLQARMTWDGSKLLRHTLQFIAITSSIYTGMTRVSDYKHHWSDVLSGFLIGAITAILVAKYVSTLFPCNYKRFGGSRDISCFNMNGRQATNQAV